MKQNVKKYIEKVEEIKPIFKYAPDGIYINFGMWRGTNLTKLYLEKPDQVLGYLENIIESEYAPAKLVKITKEVVEDIKNGYPDYDLR